MLIRPAHSFILSYFVDLVSLIFVLYFAGPQSISYRSRQNEAPLEAGMMVTDGKSKTMKLALLLAASQLKL